MPRKEEARGRKSKAKKEETGAHNQMESSLPRKVRRTMAASRGSISIL
jgi:hypothetical protein